MARELILIGDIRMAGDRVVVVGPFAGDYNDPPKKSFLLGKKIKINTEKKSILATIDDVYINYTLSNVYVITIGTSLKSKKDISVDDMVYLDE